MNAVATTSIAGSQQVLGLSSSVAKRVSLTVVGQIVALTERVAQNCVVFAKPNTTRPINTATVSIHDSNWKHARIIQGGNP